VESDSGAAAGAGAGAGADAENQLKLEDAGEGAVPLRLLACGHVFHVRVPIGIAPFFISPRSRFFSGCDTENVLGPVADRRFWPLSCLSESCRASGQAWQEAATGLILGVRFRCHIIY
jgi:hypothetical protein